MPDQKSLADHFPIDSFDPSEPKDVVISRSGFQTLTESIAALGGNRIPALFWVDERGRRRLRSGNGRYYASLIAGLKTLYALEVAKDLTPKQELQLYAADNGCRRVLTLEEWAELLEQMMALEGCNQAEACKALSISEPHGSRALLTVTLPAEFRDKLKHYPSSTRAVIAGIKEKAQLEKVVAYAVDTKNPKETRSRAEIELFIKMNTVKPGRPSKLHKVKGAKDSQIAELVIRGSDPMKVVQELRARAALIEKNAAYGMDAVVAILRGKGNPPEAGAAVTA